MAYGWGKGWGYSWGLADPVNLLIPYENLLPWQGVGPYPANYFGTTPGEYGLYEINEIQAGTYADEQPIPVPTQAFSGFRMRTFFDDFYFRTYIFPKQINFGIIASNTSINFEIWNAHLSPVTLELVSAVSLGDQGVEVLTAELPAEILPIDTTIYSVAADVTGPSEVNGLATFNFSTGEIRQLEVIGVRGLLWPFLPNWSRGFRQSYEYLTEVITAHSGREQRIARRQTPRRFIEFTSHCDRDDRRELNRLLDGFQHVEFVVPEIPRRMNAVDAVPVSQTAFEVDSIPDWLEVGSLIVVIGDSVSLRRVLTFDALSNTVTFENDGPAEPAGAMLCYGLLGYLDTSLQTRRLTDEVVEMTFRFETRPGAETFLEPGAAPVTYAGREVLLREPDWSEPLQVEFARETEVLDYGSGVVARFNPVAYGTRTTRAKFTNMNYAEFEEMREVFARARGQRGEFFRPTGERDLVAKLPLYINTETLRVEGLGIFKAYGDSDVFKHIMIVLKNGTRIFRTVDSITTIDDANGEDTILEMTTEWTSTIQPSDIEMICWMPVCRFASDGMTVDWMTDDKSQMQLAFKTIEALAAE